VETGTQAAVAAAVLNGAHIVRVHDVGNTLATVKVVDAILAS
jgi:dihydropteroate synthase